MKQEEFFDEQIIDMINQSEQKTIDSVSNHSKAPKKQEESATPKQRNAALTLVSKF